MTTQSANGIFVASSFLFASRTVCKSPPDFDEYRGFQKEHPERLIPLKQNPPRRKGFWRILLDVQMVEAAGIESDLRHFTWLSRHVEWATKQDAPRHIKPIFKMLAQSRTAYNDKRDTLAVKTESEKEYNISTTEFETFGSLGNSE